MIDVNKLNQMELALIAEAIRLLTKWWPNDTPTFWISRTALLAVLGGRAGLSSSAEEECRLILDQFNKAYRPTPHASASNQTTGFAR